MVLGLGQNINHAFFDLAVLKKLPYLETAKCRIFDSFECN